MSRRTSIRLSVVGACLIGAGLLATVTRAGIYSGTVASANPKSQRLTVEANNGKSKSFNVPKDVELTIDDEKADLAGVQAGHHVSVYLSSAGDVTRVRVRTKSAEAPVPASEPGAAAAATLIAAATGATSTPAPGWPQFGGPGRDNRSGDSQLMNDWPTDGPPLVMQVDGLGIGYSSVSIADGKVFTMGTDSGEQVIALDAESGDKVWQTPVGSIRQDGMGGGPRSTPTIDGDRVYALGANGDLACLAIGDGSLIWTTNILDQFEGDNIAWGISESVLIDGDHLICTPGGKQATMAALDKRTGEVVWRAKAPGTPAAAYASAIIVEAEGVRQYVNFTHTGVIGVQADNGDYLWSNSASANGTANCSSPVAFANFVFSSSGYGQGCALVELTGKRGRAGADLVYANKELRSHHGGIVLDGQYVYGADEGILKCLDVTTGEVRWQDRSVGKGAVVYADGKIILRSEQGPVAMLEATPEEYREHGRFEQPSRSGQAAWAHPVVADGKLYLRDQGLMLVYDLRGK